MDGPRGRLERVNVVFHSHGRASSLGWLLLGVVFGGSFLAAGFAPGGKPINFFIGGPILLFFFGLALWDLGRSDVLLVDRPAGRALLLRGRFHRRERVAFGLKDVERLVLVTSTVHTGGKSSSRTNFFDLLIRLRDGRALTLPLRHGLDPEREAREVGYALGRKVEREEVAGHGP